MREETTHDDANPGFILTISTIFRAFICPAGNLLKDITRAGIQEERLAIIGMEGTGLLIDTLPMDT